MKKGPNFGQFFYCTLPAAAIGVLLALVIFAITSCVRTDYKDGELRYMHAVYLAVADKKLPVGQPLNSRDDEGRAVGIYLRDAAKAGFTFKESILYLERASELSYKYVDTEGLMSAMAERYELSTKVPASIFHAARSSGYMDSLKEKGEVITQIIKGQAGIPLDWEEYPIVPSWLLKFLVFIAQSIAVFGYLVQASEENFSWWRLPWRRIWPFFGILFFLPGGIPVLVIAGAGTFAVYGFEWFEEWNRRSAVEKKSKVSPDGDRFVEESRERLEELRKRI